MFWSLIYAALNAVSIAGFLGYIYGKLFNPIFVAGKFSNHFGIAIALLSSISLIHCGMMVFVSWYGETLLQLPIFGKWYDSRTYPLLILAPFFPAFAGILLWIPYMRTNSFAFLAILTVMMLPMIHQVFFLDDIPSAPEIE